MEVRKYAFLFFAALIGISSAWAQNSSNLDLHLKVSAIAESSKPEVYGSNVIFTYRDPNAVQNARLHYVGVAFRNENFSKIHTLERNDYGVYFFVYPIPEGVDTLEYRYVVDGLWITDPKNSDTLTLPDTGVNLSLISVPIQTRQTKVSPELLPGDRVQFLLTSTPGTVVYVAGSFNNWDPYMHRMVEVTPGHYELTIRVRPGTYYYYFVANGHRISDPLNSAGAFSPDGFRVSVFRVS